MILMISLCFCVETTLYRVVQESLHNVEKHAEAQGVDIVLQKEGKYLLLTISDDGKGFSRGKLLQKKSNNPMLEHMGLENMKERIQAIGGDFKVTSDAAQGTEVRVSLRMEFI